MISELMTIRKKNRRGAAFFMLVLSVLIVITAATAALVRGEWIRRKHTRDTARTQTMVAAIEAIAATDSSALTLRINDENDENDERIELKAETLADAGLPDSQQQRRYTARWLRGGKQVDVLVREKKRTASTNHPKGQEP